jgi:hypothetical protein
MNLLRRLLVFLSSLAADPAVIETEPPKAAAAVAVASASMAKPKVREEEKDPPLVPVSGTVQRRSGRIIYENGRKYWVDEITGARYRFAD